MNHIDHQYSRLKSPDIIAASKIIFFSLVFLYPGLCVAQQAELLKESSTPVKQIIDTLLHEAEGIASANSELELGLEKATLALKLSTAENLKPQITRSHYVLGIIYTDNGDFDPALEHLETAIKLYKEQEDNYGLVLCKKQLGILYNDSGDTEKGLMYYIDALHLAEKISWKEEELKLINNIGTIYLAQNHYAKAIEYFERCISMEPDAKTEAIVLGNIGLAYSRLGDYDMAISYFERSTATCREIGDEQCELGRLSLMVTTYMLQQKYDLALKLSYEISERQERLGAQKELLINYNRMGLLYWYTLQYDSAINYFNKSFVIAKEINYSSIHLIHANMAFVYRDAGKYKLALEHLLVHQSLKDSLLTAEKNRVVEELLAKYDAEKQNKEIEILQKEKELQNAELERKALTQNVAIGGAGLILIVSVIILVNYQQKIKAQKLLSIKTEELNRQKKTELIRENEIRSIKSNIEGQEKERERIAKELHDGVAGNLAGIKLILANFSNKSNPSSELQKAIKNIDDTYHEVRSLSHHLIPPKIKENEFIELIKNYINDLSKMHAFKVHLGYHPEKELNLLPDDIKKEIYRIIQELMNNIIKHAQAEHVEIQLTKLNGSLNLMIEDNGVGFEPSSTSRGIGLNNIHSRVRILEGEVHIDTSIGRGTIVDITIPVIDN